MLLGDRRLLRRILRYISLEEEGTGREEEDGHE
jgi:hypothetical protein